MFFLLPFLPGSDSVLSWNLRYQVKIQSLLIFLHQSQILGKKSACMPRNTDKLYTSHLIQEKKYISVTNNTNNSISGLIPGYLLLGVFQPTFLVHEFLPVILPTEIHGQVYCSWVTPLLL